MSIQIKKLSYVYKAGTPFEKVALKDINLNIEAGEFVGIIGHTGSGKSTLVQHFNGILKPSPGCVYVHGIDVASKQIKDLRKKVGLVFQYPEYQLFEETVYKDIAFALVKQKVAEEEIEKKVSSVLSLVGLSGSILYKSPFELSGGQKRRVAIAGVLVMEPSILILDEPAAGLDPKGRDEIYQVLSDLHRSSGITVILVSHSMEDIARLVDRVIVMNNGTVEITGRVKEVFKNPEVLERMGLSAPQITYFMRELKKIIPQIDENIVTVDEAKEAIKKVLLEAKQ